MRALILVILVSVVSAQTFFNTDRRGYRTSNNFRRQNGNGAVSGSAADAPPSSLTQLKEPADSATGYPAQEQAQLADGAGAGGSSNSATSGVPADDVAPDAPVDAADDADVPGADVPVDEAGDVADQPDEDAGAGGVAVGQAEKDPNDLTWLRNAIRGEPDTDYPILSEIPKTSFKCSGEQFAGYYGDPEARCQVFHICQKPDDRMDSFLCPNGTIFSQKNFVCVWWWQYDCSQTEKDFALNANLYAGGESGDGQSNAVDGAAGGVAYSDDNGADTGTGAADAAVPSPALPGDEDAADVPAAGGVDDADGSSGDAATDGEVAPIANPLPDDGAVEDSADDAAAGGAISPGPVSTAVAGKTNAAGAAAVRRRLRGRARGRFAGRSGRRSSRRRSTRRGLRSRSTGRRGRGRSAARRPVVRSPRRRNAGRRAGRRTLVSRRSRRNRN